MQIPHLDFQRLVMHIFLLRASDNEMWSGEMNVEKEEANQSSLPAWHRICTVFGTITKVSDLIVTALVQLQGYC